MRAREGAREQTSENAGKPINLDPAEISVTNELNSCWSNTLEMSRLQPPSNRFINSSPHSGCGRLKIIAHARTRARAQARTHTHTHMHSQCIYLKYIRHTRTHTYTRTQIDTLTHIHRRTMNTEYFHPGHEIWSHTTPCKFVNAENFTIHFRLTPHHATPDKVVGLNIEACTPVNLENRP